MQLQWVEGKAMPKWNVKWNNNLMSKNSNCCSLAPLLKWGGHWLQHAARGMTEGNRIPISMQG